MYRPDKEHKIQIKAHKLFKLKKTTTTITTKNLTYTPLLSEYCCTAPILVIII